jgi:uncharacterized phage protein gp47/JayE
VSLVERTYPDIVKDMLTVLTGGIASEVYPIVYATGQSPQPLPQVVLKRRPVTRISAVSGFIGDRTADDELLPYSFGLNDYELISSDAAHPEALDTIRFLPFGHPPADGTSITVNYYPRNAEKTVITDVNVGSVARTMLETVARELGALYAQLNLAYDGGFVETATGSALDRVVALLGYRRFRAGRASGVVSFTRRPGNPGEITIPAGTPVTDTTDKIRYETIDSHLIRAEESVAQVRVRGASEATPVVEPNTLTVIGRAVAGLSGVTNERATTRSSDNESDDDLRLRVSGALAAASKGTVESIRYGLMNLPEVRDVVVTEMPNGLPGEIDVAVSLADGSTTMPAKIVDRLEQLRPAGIRTTLSTARTMALQARVTLTLAGSSATVTERQQITAATIDTMVAAVRAKDIGQALRIRPLAAALLADSRIVDAEVLIGTDAVGDKDVAAPSGTALELTKESVTVTVTFEQQPATDTIPLEVRGTFVLTGTIGATTLDDAKTGLRAKLTSYFAGLKPGDAVDGNTILTAVRDDAKYGVDPMKLLVMIGAPDEGVAVTVAGAQPFIVAAKQVFEVLAPEVKL